MPPAVRSPLDASRIAKWKLGDWEESGSGHAIVTVDDPDSAVAWAPELKIAEDIVAQHNDWVVFNFG